MKKMIFVILSLSLCVSCQSTPLKDYDRISLGTSKRIVLDELGSPKRSFRSDGTVDHWIYSFLGSNGQPVEREICFQDGRVISKKALGEPKDSDFVPL